MFPISSFLSFPLQGSLIVCVPVLVWESLLTGSPWWLWKTFVLQGTLRPPTFGDRWFKHLVIFQLSSIGWSPVGWLSRKQRREMGIFYLFLFYFMGFWSSFCNGLIFGHGFALCTKVIFCYVTKEFCWPMEFLDKVK